MDAGHPEGRSWHVDLRSLICKVVRNSFRLIGFPSLTTLTSEARGRGTETLVSLQTPPLSAAVNPGDKSPKSPGSHAPSLLSQPERAATKHGGEKRYRARPPLGNRGPNLRAGKEQCPEDAEQRSQGKERGGCEGP